MTVNGVFYLYCYQPLLYLLELQHTSDHFSIHGLGVCLRYPYADRIVVALFGIEIQFVAAVAFCHIRFVLCSLNSLHLHLILLYGMYLMLLI